MNEQRLSDAISRRTFCGSALTAAAGLYIAGSAWLPRFMAEATQHGASIGLAI